MVKQAHVINLHCDVRIFSTVYGCGKYYIYNSEIFTKVWLCSKGNTLVTGHYQHVIINLYTMHNKFSNFLCFASSLCSSLCSADQF